MNDAIRRARRVRAVPAAAMGIGAAGLLAGLAIDVERVAFAWLAAYTSALAIALGMLALVMIAHVTRAKWFVAVRRLAELGAGAIPVFILLFIPLVPALEGLYPWASPPSGLEAHARQVLEKRESYLNPTFWLVRAALYFLTWTFLAWRLRAWSFRQDRGDAAGTDAPVRVSAPGLIAFGFTMTFAAIDWIMSLSAEWQSTIFGIYWFAGGFLGAVAVLIITVTAFSRDRDDASADHIHALGRLLLAFTIFWAYIAFAQGFLIWIADLPREVRWYLDRSEDGWGVILAILILGHFVIPFAALLSRRLKRDAKRLSLVAALVLVMHVIDTFWLVIPAIAGQRPVLHWIDAAALLAVYGAAVSFATWRASGHPLTARGDPRFAEAIAYRSP